jgi:hypothetical protein
MSLGPVLGVSMYFLLAWRGMSWRGKSCVGAGQGELTHIVFFLIIELATAGDGGGSRRGRVRVRLLIVCGRGG